jgi:predicted GTPase
MSIDFKNYRIDDIQRKIDCLGVQPLDVMVTGVTGAGKSTTLNTFFQKYVAKVGDGVDPETMELDAYSLNDYLRLWDTPGLGDGVDKDEIHKKKITELLNKTYTSDGREYGFIDMVLVIIEGTNRDMGTTYKILNDVIVPNISKYRILVLINQADMAMKGRHWDYKLNKPDKVLLEFLDKQVSSIKERVKEATGVQILKPVYYSAEYGYNVEKVFDFIIENMPIDRRKIRR